MTKEIDLEQMDVLLKNGALLVDCREDEEVEAGMIPGAEHMALSELDNFADKIPKDRETVFYCRSGKRSLAACEMASQWTEKQLYSLAGGYLRYQEERGD